MNSGPNVDRNLAWPGRQTPPPPGPVSVNIAAGVRKSMCWVVVWPRKLVYRLKKAKLATNDLTRVFRPPEVGVFTVVVAVGVAVPVPVAQPVPAPTPLLATVARTQSDGRCRLLPRATSSGRGSSRRRRSRGTVVVTATAATKRGASQAATWRSSSTTTFFSFTSTLDN